MNDGSPPTSATGPALPPPSRESLREVKAEAKERKRARRAGYDNVYEYRARPRRSHKGVWAVAVVAVIGTIAAGTWFLAPGVFVNTLRLGEDESVASQPSFDVEQEARRLMSRGPWKDWKPGMAGLTIKPPDAQESLGLSEADAAQALKSASAYIETALFKPAVLFDGELGPVVETLGGDDRELARSMSDRNPLTPAASAYMNRFRPEWVTGTGVSPKASGVVEDEVTYRVLPGVGAQAAFKVASARRSRTRCSWDLIKRS